MADVFELHTKRVPIENVHPSSLDVLYKEIAELRNRVILMEARQNYLMMERGMTETIP